MYLLAVATAFGGSATWNLNPTSGDWNTATNWTPTTVPNGPDDTATFGVSSTTDVSFPFLATFEVNGIVFNPGASAFTIDVLDSTLTISGAGIMNNSGITQNFEILFLSDAILFLHSATAGSGTAFTNDAGGEFSPGGFTKFFDTSTAGDGTFTNNSAAAFDNFGGSTQFFDSSTAGNGSFTNKGDSYIANGVTQFFNTSTAGNGTFTNDGGAVSLALGGSTQFFDTSTAGNGTFTSNAGTVSNGFSSPLGGQTQFFGTSTAANGTFINNGAPVAFAGGGGMQFFDTSTAGNGTLVANGGVSDGLGGSIQFNGSSTGVTAHIEVFGNGTLDISLHNAPGITIGSIEGTGILFLGSNNLTVGSNNLSTTFSGVIQDGGSFTKIGKGTLVLTNGNTYTGGTSVKRGRLVVNNTTGSGTGSGPVQVTSGTLGGKGIIAGAVTIGTGGSSRGAVLAPGTDGLGLLTIQSTLTFGSNATYNWNMDAKVIEADGVVAQGVTIESGARFFTFGRGAGHAPLPSGTVFTVISNTSATPIVGTFSDLLDGHVFSIGRSFLSVSYEGGDGNDLTLTVL